jgi:hypothetical protein
MALPLCRVSCGDVGETSNPISFKTHLEQENVDDISGEDCKLQFELKVTDVAARVDVAADNGREWFCTE